MIYIFETEILNNKTLKISLQGIYGLGKQQAVFICKNLGYSENFLTGNLNNSQIIKLVKFIENSDLIVTTELKKKQIFLLKMLIEIKAYRGLRKLNGFPVRGQRTHTNARTAKRFKRR